MNEEPTTKKGREIMPEIKVVPGEKKGKFKVLVNGIRQGVEYSTEVHAEYEAEKIRKSYTG